MICVIDYQTGNIGAVLNMFKKIGAEVLASSDANEIEKADKLVLLGIGAFDSGMENLKKLDLIPLLRKKVIKQKTPILGICLGMQLFAQKSEEGVLGGLNWIAGEVKKFKFNSSNLKIPHMGWNNIDIKKQDNIFNNIPKEPRFYFVHSYYFVCNDKNNILATTNYGYDFPSIIRKENIIGVQFHPEKSHKFGMQLLTNFAKL